MFILKCKNCENIVAKSGEYDGKAIAFICSYCADELPTISELPRKVITKAVA